jgi:glutathione S-transferase
VGVEHDLPIPGKQARENGLSVNRWLKTPLERPETPAVMAYYEKLSERPAFMEYGRDGFP